MRKKFNITGSCNPERHYMVNSKALFEAVEDLIGAGEYFTINRARQYGKTTTLYMIWRQLSDRYTVVPLSLEGIGDRGRFRMQVNYAPGGRLDMEQVITRFAELMHQEYRESTVPFLEKEIMMTTPSIEMNYKGLMSDNGYSYPSAQMLKNIFASSCVETIARNTHVSTTEAYKRMKDVELFHIHSATCILWTN